jgi:hypothetical protein
MFPVFKYLVFQIFAVLLISLKVDNGNRIRKEIFKIVDLTQAFKLSGKIRSLNGPVFECHQKTRLVTNLDSFKVKLKYTV